MTWTLCTSGSAIHNAGANANTAIVISGSALADYSDWAENYISTAVRFDVVTNLTSFTAQGRQIFENLCANIIAKKIIKYDPSGYTTIGEAIAITNIIESETDDLFALVKEDKYKTYLAVT